MTDTAGGQKRRTVLLAATIQDGEKFSSQLEARGDEVLIVTPRTANRLRGYLADRVLHTPRAVTEPGYREMCALARICLLGNAERHLTAVQG